MSDKIYKGIRIEKDIYDYILNKVDGKDFTDKFHNLVYLIIKDLPNIKKELKELYSEIKSKTEELHNIEKALQKLRTVIWDYQLLINSMDRVKSSVNELVKFCNNVISN